MIPVFADDLSIEYFRIPQMAEARALDAFDAKTYLAQKLAIKDVKAFLTKHLGI